MKRSTIVFVEPGMLAGTIVRLCQHRNEIRNSAGVTTVPLNIKEGPQPTSLFEIPSHYRKITAQSYYKK